MATGSDSNSDGVRALGVQLPHLPQIGNVAEWFKALVLKTRGCNSPVGSNPTVSSMNKIKLDIDDNLKKKLISLVEKGQLPSEAVSDRVSPERLSRALKYS